MFELLKNYGCLLYQAEYVDSDNPDNWVDTWVYLMPKNRVVLYQRGGCQSCCAAKSIVPCSDFVRYTDGARYSVLTQDEFNAVYSLYGSYHKTLSDLLDREFYGGVGLVWTCD